MNLFSLLLLSLLLVNSKGQRFSVLNQYKILLKKLGPDKLELADHNVPLLPKDCVTDEDNIFVGNGNSMSELILRNLNTKRIQSGAFTGPKSLKVLVIRDNAIKELPASPFKLANLETLVFTNNQLEKFDAKTFVGLPKLNKLDLTRNRLKELPPEVLKPIPTLYNIDLSRNMIKFVAGKTFMYLNKFADNIVLADNGITDIDSHALPQDARIENLTLTRNKLSDIRFEGIRGIVRLDVRNNDISCLNPANVAKVVVVKADGNPWKCVCLKSYLREKGAISELFAPNVFQRCGMKQCRITYVDV